MGGQMGPLDGPMALLSNPLLQERHGPWQGYANGFPYDFEFLDAPGVAFAPTHHGEAKETAARASKKQKYMASSIVRIAPHKNSIRRSAAPLTQIPHRTASEGYRARKRTAVVSRSRAETLYQGAQAKL